MDENPDGNRFFMREATPDDNDALCRLLEIPMPGKIKLALERSPDYFRAAGVQNNEAEVALCCDRQEHGQIAGIACLGRRRVFIDGNPVWVRYLSDLRVLENYRGMRLARMIADYIWDSESKNSSHTMQSIVFSDNVDIKRFGNHPESEFGNTKHLWCYEMGAYKTSAIKLSPAERKYWPMSKIRRAEPKDIPEMQNFFDLEASRKQFYPAYRFDQLGDGYYQGLTINDFFLAFRNGKLVGITGYWDQCAMKQTRIAGYSGILRWCRPFFNLLSRSLSGFPLPRAGTELLSFYLHTIVTCDNNPEIFSDLIEHIYKTYQNSNYLYFVCGLFSDDELCRVLENFKSRRNVHGKHYEVGIYEIGQPIPPDMPIYVEACRI